MEFQLLNSVFFNPFVSSGSQLNTAEFDFIIIIGHNTKSFNKILGKNTHALKSLCLMNNYSMFRKPLLLSMLTLNIN